MTVTIVWIDVVGNFSESREICGESLGIAFWPQDKVDVIAGAVRAGREILIVMSLITHLRITNTHKLKIKTKTKI